MARFTVIPQDWGNYSKVTIIEHNGGGVVELYVYNDTDTAEIGGLYVIPSMRGKGLAKMLIAKAEEWAQILGATRTKLLAEPQLTAFYKELGYSKSNNTNEQSNRI